MLRGTNSGEQTGGASTLSFDATLTKHPLDLVRLAATGGDDQITANMDHLSCLITLGQVNRASIPTNEAQIEGLNDPRHLIWNTVDAQAGGTDTAIFDVQLSAKEMEEVGGEPVRITRSYSLAPDSYVLDMSVQLELSLIHI